MVWYLEKMVFLKSPLSSTQTTLFISRINGPKLAFLQMQAKLGISVYVNGIVLNSLQSNTLRQRRAVSVYGVLFSCVQHRGVLVL